MNIGKMRSQVSSFGNICMPLLTAILFLIPARSALAGNIPVANFSFETVPAGWPNGFCGGTCVYDTGLPIPGWNSTGVETGQRITGGFDGNPPAINGSVLAYSNGGTIWQDVATAVAGTTYTLQVDVLARTDAAEDGIVQLEIGGVVVATAPAVDAGPGTWNNEIAVYTANASQAGETITILLSSNGYQGDWDNVRLSTGPSAVPEPASCILLGTALAGLLTRRLHRKKLHANTQLT